MRYRNEWHLAAEILYGQAVIDSQQATRAGLPSMFIPISDRLAADLRPRRFQTSFLATSSSTTCLTGSNACWPLSMRTE